MTLTRSLFRNKNFMYLWLGQAFFQLGTSFVDFTLFWWLHGVWGSAMGEAFVLAAYRIPGIILGPLAGVLGDRVDRKKILLWSTIIRVVGTLAILFMLNSIWFVILFTFVISFTNNFFRPTEGASIPNVATSEQLFLANSLFLSTEHGTTFIACIVVWPIIELFEQTGLFVSGSIGTFIIAAILFIGASALLALLPNMLNRLRPDGSYKSSSEPAEIRAEQTFLKEVWLSLAAGIKFVAKSKKALQMLIHLGVVHMVILIVITMARSFGEEILKVGSSGTSLLVMAPVVLGVVIGIFVLNKVDKIWSKDKIMSVGILTAISALGFNGLLGNLIGDRKPSTTELSIIMVTLGILGTCVTFMMIPAITYLQEISEDKLRSRVFGIMNAIVASASALPLFLFAYLIRIWGVINTGFLLSILGLLYLVWFEIKVRGDGRIARVHDMTLGQWLGKVGRGISGWQEGQEP